MKKVASFAIDEDILKKFNDHAKDRHINKSSLVQELIEDFLKRK